MSDEFSDEAVGAVLQELPDVELGSGAFIQGACDSIRAARLILAARRERDEEKKWRAFHDLQAQRIMIERDAALVRAEAAFTEGTLAAGNAMRARIAALEAENAKLRQRVGAGPC